MTLAIWLTIYLLTIAGAAYLWYKLMAPGRAYDDWMESLERDESEGPWGHPREAERVRVSKDRMQGL